MLKVTVQRRAAKKKGKGERKGKESKRREANKQEHRKGRVMADVN
jgi:hypothetical protein